MKNNPWKIFGSKTVYQNQWIRVREDEVARASAPDVRGIYSVVETKDSVIIGALNDKSEIYLIYSFSYPAQTWQWELPGGGSDGEDIMLASKRELAEEAGIIAEDWTLIGDTRVCDGIMTERMKTLLARNLTIGQKAESDDNEVIADGRFFSFDEVHRMVTDGLIDEGQSITALYLIERHLTNG